MGVGVLCVMIGVVVGTGWISYTAGRLFRRYGRGPVTLLSGARLMADPWNGSRTIGALLAAVVFGAGTLGLRADLATDLAAQDRFDQLTAPPGAAVDSGVDTGFYFGAFRLVMVAVTIALVVAAGGVLVAFAEGIVARRRTFAAMTAGGVPRRTLGAMLLVVTFTPLLPALLLALICGASLMRSMRTEVVVSGDTLTFTLPIPVPVAHLALLGGGAVLVMLLVVGAGMMVLRSSTDLEELRAS